MESGTYLLPTAVLSSLRSVRRVSVLDEDDVAVASDEDPPGLGDVAAHSNNDQPVGRIWSPMNEANAGCGQARLVMRDAVAEVIHLGQGQGSTAR